MPLNRAPLLYVLYRDRGGMISDSTGLSGTPSRLLQWLQSAMQASNWKLTKMNTLPLLLRLICSYLDGWQKSVRRFLLVWQRVQGLLGTGWQHVPTSTSLLSFWISHAHIPSACYSHLPHGNACTGKASSALMGTLCLAREWLNGILKKLAVGQSGGLWGGQ